MKEDGNDGAHQGTLIAEDAEDLRDFTIALLESLYNEPGRLKAAKKRRSDRRSGNQNKNGPRALSSGPFCLFIVRTTPACRVGHSIVTRVTL